MGGTTTSNASQQDPPPPPPPRVCLHDFMTMPTQQSLEQFLTSLGSSPTESQWFLQELVQADESNASRLLSIMIPMLQVEQTRHAVLLFCLEVSGLTTAAASVTDTDHYGKPPPRWSDLLVSSIPTLLPIMDVEKLLVSNILGNLVQDSTEAMAYLRPRWNVLVQALPQSAYACASLLRNDTTSYASLYLQELKPTHLMGLFKEETTDIYAAWMLEALSQREDAAVDVLCQQEHLMHVLVERIVHVKHRPDFLVPALRAIGNCVTAREGRYVPMVLNQPNFVVPTLLTLLNERAHPYDSSTLGVVLSECLWLMGCLLCDAGLESHPSTAMADTVLPHVVDMWTNKRQPTDARKGAAMVLVTALNEPPGMPSHQRVYYQAYVQRVVEQYMWKSMDQRDAVLQSLVMLLQLPDNDAIGSSLFLLDQLFHHISLSREVWDHLSGWDRLEDLASDGTVGRDISRMAADLIDEYGSEHEEIVVKSTLHPVVPKDRFVFGAPLPPATVGVPGAGRGRGRTLPAWMQKEQMS